MSLIQMRFFSEKLNRFTGVNVILALDRRIEAPAGRPTLYLLHGMGDDQSAWLRKTNVERYALEAGLHVVMPDGGLSCYENMIHGERYRDYLLLELPHVMRSCFPMSPRREENFIAGCSMGGCGALKLGLAHPECFRAIGCFSAGHLEYRPDADRNRAMLARAFGNRLELRDAEIIESARAANAGSDPIGIWHACGDADVLRDSCMETKAFFESMSGGAIDYRFRMLPGRHDWALWDGMLREFLSWLPLPEETANAKARRKRGQLR